MPNFPARYNPSQPEVLNPLNPAHHILVLRWVFFQPGQIKNYLYQADPNLYSRTGLRAIGRILHAAAYRNMCIMALIWLIPTGITIYAADLAGWRFFAELGTLLGQDMGFSNTSFKSAGAALAVGAAIIALFLVLSSSTVNFLKASLTFAVAIGVACGLAFLLSIVVATFVVINVTGSLYVDVSLPFYFTVYIVFFSAGFIIVLIGLSSAFAANIGNRYLDVITGLIVGLLFFLCSALFEVTQTNILPTLGMGWGVVAIGQGLLGYWIYLPISILALVFGICRGLFYIVEWPSIWVRSRQTNAHNHKTISHPLIWDELILFPIHNSISFVNKELIADTERGLELVTRIAANPFQRGVAQHALLDWLTSQPNPLSTLQFLVAWPFLDTYLIFPTTRREFRDFPPARMVLLGEIGQQPVDGRTSEQISRMERLVWRLTRRMRYMKSTPISQFSAMLYTILHDEAEIEEQHVTDFQLVERFQSVYEGIRIYPHGYEVANSWASLAALLETTTFEQIGIVHEQLTWIPNLEQPSLSQVVIDTLKALGDVSRSVAACLQATSLPNQTVALNQAAGGLQELVAYVEKELWPPERALYLVLIKNWQSLVASEQGRLGENALRQMSPGERLATGLVDRTSSVWQRPAKPLANPYIAGDPVIPPLFVGRRDIFTRINEIWHAKTNPDSIILYGHRRMGKSSILRNLDQAAPGRVIVCTNLQGETSFVASTADLLLALADRIYAEVKRARPDAVLPQPPADQFNTPAAAQIQFNRFLEQVRTALGDSGMILALDEFEAIEEAVCDGKVGKEIYQYLRAKTQEPWITVVFGGLHTLDEMSRDYAQPFYGSYQNIVVSYLAPADAAHLITNPTPDFTVNYEPVAIDRIIGATGGQPYLVQLVCRDALDHLNHELFDEHCQREVRITLADVDAVLGDDLFRRGTGYFDGVWTQVREAAQQNLLRCMAQCDEAWTPAELKAVTHLMPDELHHHLQLAQRRDILRQCDGVWEFCVPLLRRWICEKA